MESPLDEQKLKTVIQEWVQLDELMSVKRQELKQATVQKKKVSDTLLGLMKANNIDDFSLKGGSLRRKSITKKSPLNKQLLLAVLSRYYEPEQNAVEKANEMTSMLLSSRNVKVTEILTREKITS